MQRESGQILNNIPLNGTGDRGRCTCRHKSLYISILLWYICCSSKDTDHFVNENSGILSASFAMNFKVTVVVTTSPFFIIPGKGGSMFYGIYLQFVLA